MPATDRTSEFRLVLKEASQLVPDAKRRKVTKSSTSSQREGQDVLNKEYLAEAYNVVRPHNTYSFSYDTLGTYASVCS